MTIIMQNKANLKNEQMDIKLNITRDYEKKLHWTLGENKANQSQSAIGGQVSENRGLPASGGIEDGGQMAVPLGMAYAKDGRRRKELHTFVYIIAL